MQEGDLVAVKDMHGDVWTGRVCPGDSEIFTNDSLLKIKETDGGRSVYCFASEIRSIGGKYLSKEVRQDLLTRRLEELKRQYGAVFLRLMRSKRYLEISFTLKGRHQFTFDYVEAVWTEADDPLAQAFFEGLLQAEIISREGEVNLEFG